MESSWTGPCSSLDQHMATSTRAAGRASYQGRRACQLPGPQGMPDPGEAGLWKHHLSTLSPVCGFLRLPFPAGPTLRLKASLQETVSQACLPRRASLLLLVHRHRGPETRSSTLASPSMSEAAPRYVPSLSAQGKPNTSSSPVRSHPTKVTDCKGHKRSLEDDKILFS